MLTIRSTGRSIADAIASVQNVPRTLVPYATATALTRTARHAEKTALPQAMRAAFDGVTSWTLNSLRTEPASKDKLSARVLVKNEAAGGIPQEKFLRPEVEGGARGNKRFENALRYAGVLRAGQYAMPGQAMELDANGNVKGVQVRTILAALKGVKAASNQGRGLKRVRKGGTLKNDLFVGKPRGKGRPEGIWRREGHRLRPLFVFANQAPNYAQRLDFAGTVAQVARDRFRVEFDKAVAEQVAKGWK